MTPSRLLRTAILPALAELKALGIPPSASAARFMLAIALQESEVAHRRQLVGGEEKGPATSFWQFEKGGGCKGVLTHRSSADHMERICRMYNVPPTPESLWSAMQYQDIVAAAAARLLIYTLPRALPDTAESGWVQYIAAWRPGKPHPHTWQANWDTATQETGA